MSVRAKIISQPAHPFPYKPRGCEISKTRSETPFEFQTQTSRLKKWILSCLSFSFQMTKINSYFQFRWFFLSTLCDVHMCCMCCGRQQIQQQISFVMFLHPDHEILIHHPRNQSSAMQTVVLCTINVPVPQDKRDKPSKSINTPPFRILCGFGFSKRSWGPFKWLIFNCMHTRNRQREKIQWMSSRVSSEESSQRQVEFNDMEDNYCAFH